MSITISAVLIETTRLEELAEFYKAGFDLDSPDPEDEEQVGFQMGEVYFGLERVEETSVPSKAMSLWFTVEDTQAVYDRLLSLGAASKSEPEEVDGEIIASVFDPDGNVIGLLCDL
jgi:predicted enzyme related to lactoylglutathione lyase